MKLTGCCKRRLHTVSWCTAGAMAPVPRPQCWTPQQTVVQRWQLFPVCGWRCSALEIASCSYLLPSSASLGELECGGGELLKGSTHMSSKCEVAHVQPHHSSSAARVTLHPGNTERWALCRERTSATAGHGLLNQR